jgi:hypothetical protein
VRHPGLVQRVGRPRGVLQSAVDLRPRQRPRGRGQRAEREVLHRVGEGVLEDGVVHGDEVGRADGRERAQLAHSAVVGELAHPVAEHLERDELVGQLQPGRGAGEVVAAVVALAELAHDHVVGDGGGNGGLRAGIGGRRERGRVHP